jgi:hypothetical protein
LLTSNGNIRYQLKTPYRESLPRERSECFGHGTTHVIFEPLDFIARLAALVPKPRVNLTRFHGVFAPNSKHRALVTKAARRQPENPAAAGQRESGQYPGAGTGHAGRLDDGYRRSHSPAQTSRCTPHGLAGIQKQLSASPGAGCVCKNHPRESAEYREGHRNQAAPKKNAGKQ